MGPRDQGGDPGRCQGESAGSWAWGQLLWEPRTAGPGVHPPGLSEGEVQWALLCNHPQSAGAGVRTLAGIARAALKAPEPPLSESGADPGAPSTREGPSLGLSHDFWEKITLIIARKMEKPAS